MRFQKPRVSELHHRAVSENVPFLRQIDETPLSVLIVGRGVLTACGVRDITSSSSLRPASAENGHGAKLPEKPATQMQNLLSGTRMLAENSNMPPKGEDK
jgi:hypothetical protein